MTWCQIIYLVLFSQKKGLYILTKELVDLIMIYCV